jgi:hypothetical protein
MQDTESSGWYWLAAIGLCALGVVGLFSFGAPLLLLGVALLVVSPWRSRRTVVWPTVAGVAAFVAFYLLSAPLGCTATATSMPDTAEGRTVCTNVLGIDYSGVVPYQPSLAPAAVVAIAAALIVGLAVLGVLRRSSHAALQAR